MRRRGCNVEKDEGGGELWSGKFTNKDASKQNVQCVPD